MKKLKKIRLRPFQSWMFLYQEVCYLFVIIGDYASVDAMQKKSAPENNPDQLLPNQHASLLRFLFTEDSFKMKKDLELISRSQFLKNFSMKIFLLWYINSLLDCVYFASYSVKYVSCFMYRYLMTSWHLNIWKVKTWLSQERKELSRWNKKHFSLFRFSLSFRFRKQAIKNVADTTFISP